MSIKRREIYIEMDKRHSLTNQTPVIRFADWATVTTTLGTMAEPFIANQRFQVGSTADDEGITNYSCEDEIAMVNDIHVIDLDELPRRLTGGDYYLHGGNQLPRDGR